MSRPTLIVAIVVAAIVVLAVGGKIAISADDKAQNAKAFAALRVIDRRLDLAQALPQATRSEGGQAVNFSGDGPYIAYAIDPADTPHWETRLDNAMYKAGFSKDGDPWTVQAGDFEVLIESTPPNNSNSLAYIEISTT